MIYELFGLLHKSLKKLLNKSHTKPKYRMVSISREFVKEGKLIVRQEDCDKSINGVNVNAGIGMDKVYPVENVVSFDSFQQFPDSFQNRKEECAWGVSEESAEEIWIEFIKNSKIAEGYCNSGLHYGGYILEATEWCLPSWIWTNAAIVRMLCEIQNIESAEEIGERLLQLQLPCGGWIVRSDYDKEGVIPVLAPNDSAYIANNAMLNLYRATKKEKYLSAALRCANWIINTSRQDGIVYMGYDTIRNVWQTKNNIVDIGFTAGLMAELSLITGEEKYSNYLSSFVERYIELFYNSKRKGFSTGIDENNNRIGGLFGRGQAWALEGLIPAYQLLRNCKIKKCIDDTVDMLIKKQTKGGGWSYNLSRPYLGIDCKATSLIALNLLQWNKVNERTDERILSAAHKAYHWCMKHTIKEGKAKGGIFSYTTEGAVVHHMYTKTAFVYASCYAVELGRELKTLNRIGMKQ